MYSLLFEVNLTQKKHWKFTNDHLKLWKEKENKAERMISRTLKNNSVIPYAFTDERTVLISDPWIQLYLNFFFLDLACNSRATSHQRKDKNREGKKIKGQTHSPPNMESDLISNTKSYSTFSPLVITTSWTFTMFCQLCPLNYFIQWKTMNLALFTI